jgi:hypothetical protein
VLVEDYVRNVKRKINSCRNNRTMILTWDKNDFNSSMVYEVFNLPEIQEILKKRNITITWNIFEKDFDD